MAQGVGVAEACSALQEYPRRGSLPSHGGPVQPAGTSRVGEWWGAADPGAQVSDHGIDASEMQAVQKDELLDEDSELGGQLFDVVVVRPFFLVPCAIR